MMRETRDEDQNGPRVPLKTILQNFLNHVENLEARAREGDDAYEKEFQALKSLSDSLKTQPEYSCSEGEQEVNRKKNRYKDILPFDYTRVPLSEYPGVPGSDYINGNYIKGASGSNAYIACQGPLPHTVNDFWRMVVETEVQVIVMACNEQEAGKHKCERYWSEEHEVECQYGKYFVRLLKSREICPDFLVRTMRLRWTNEDQDKTEEERTVCQFHYSAWPDHGIPTQVKPLLEMVRLIRDCQASETLPVLIHCSAGCGRTGTICAIDFIWGLLRTGKLSSDFSLYNLVRDMRKQRTAMVQTVEQYVLVHRAVKELFLEQMRVIDSHPYENIDDDGHPLADEKEDTDYETVVVNNVEDHMDQVLNQRMQKIQISSASSTSKSSSEMSSMLSNYDSLERPPQPPPKQRNLDANKIEHKTVDTTESVENPEPKERDLVAELNKDNPNLFEPPGNNNKSEPQKFKKGTLKLTQDDKGNWKIEENNPGTENNNVKGSSGSSSKKSSPKSRKGSKEDSEQPLLLRRPSIKKIKAFFQQQKEASTDFVTEAVSKLPTLGNHESKSVPNSLDRKYRENKVENEVLEKRLDVKPGGPRPQKSVSSERLLIANDGIQNVNKPLLPIKRSKSMKMVNKQNSEEDVSFGFETPAPTPVALKIPPPKPKRSLTNHDPESIRTHLTNYRSPNHSRQNSTENPSLNQVYNSFDMAEKEAAKFNDYANVQVHPALGSTQLSVAQRKISEAAKNPSQRERRNSFREAVEKSDTKAYEPIWFESQGQESAYGSTVQPVQQLYLKPDPAYANVRASPVRKVSAELTSVSLVSEVMNMGLKQNSTSSLTSSVSGQSLNGTKGPPPPYVQPPQHFLGSQQQVPSRMKISPNSTSSNVPAYANVQFRAKDTSRHNTKTKDDLVLSSMTNNHKKNRNSCGDFSQLTHFSTKGFHIHSYSDDSSIHNYNHYRSSPARNVTSVRLTGSSGAPPEFDVDLDAIAANMQSRGPVESSRQTASPQMPRPALKSRAMGMISGVAINLKSRLSHFNSNSETVVNTSGLHSGDHRPSPSPQRGQQPPAQADFRRSPQHQQHHGEQPPSVIPLTVPGADASMPSFPYGYPERLDLKPVGPRDPPAHFQRKQEYL